MILASGCFDGIHSGHVAYLAAAKAMCGDGEKLVVCVASDDYIRTAKGREPRWSIDQRVFAVSALKMVDEAQEQWSSDLSGEVRHLNPRFLVKGSDWRGRLPKDLMDAIKHAGVPVVYVPTQGQHTSERP